MKNMITAGDNDTVAGFSTIPLEIDLAFRVCAAALCLVSLNFGEAFPTNTLFALIFLVTLCCIYILAVTLLGYQRREGDLDGVRKRLGYLDCALLGAALALIPFQIVLSVSIAMIACVRATAIGGVGLLFGHLCFMSLGALAVLGAMRPAITVDLTETVNTVTLLIVPAFTAYIVWLLHRRQTRLSAEVQQFRVDNLQLKLNNYKLAKYLSPSLRKAIFSGKKVALETQRKQLTVFFSDIKGFSELSEELEADTLTQMLNLYLTEMSDIALKFGGTIDKFIGDAIMVFFGDPVTRGAKEDAIACVSMAIAMQKRMVDLNRRWASQGIRRPLHVRIGINTGFCTVGNFGTENRLDYTLLGTQVNKASRLESAADAGEILISRKTFELVKDTVYCEAAGERRLKGFRAPVEVFAARDLRANLDREGQCLDHATEGFTMFMDVDSIPHLQKHRIMSSLEEAYDRLRKDIEVNTRDDVKIFK